MARLDDHPTVRGYHERRESTPVGTAAGIPLDAAWLRSLCLEAGADDVGFVEFERPELDDQREGIVRFFPPTRSLIAFV